MDIVASQHDPDRKDSLRADTRALLEVDSAGDPDIGADLGSRLARICSAAADELGLLGAVVTVRTAGGPHAVAGASDAASRDLEEIQFGVGEGPGQDAFLAGHPILVPDLTSAFVRWPGYVPEAVRAGIGAVYAFPLQLGAVRFGLLTCYAHRARSLTADETTQGLIFAELATELLLESSSDGSSGTAGPGLQDALHLRSEIYQAQGMVTVRLGVSLVEALARMRAHAFATEQDLNALAIKIVAGDVHLPRDGQ